MCECKHYIYTQHSREGFVKLNLWYPHRLPKTTWLSSKLHTSTITCFTRYLERLVQIQFAESSSRSRGNSEHGVYLYLSVSV